MLVLHILVGSFERAPLQGEWPTRSKGDSPVWCILINLRDQNAFSIRGRGHSRNYPEPPAENEPPSPPCVSV
jgi:hypothetical protein